MRQWLNRTQHQPLATTRLDENGLPRYRQAELRVVAMPKDANPAGDIFGGWIMSHVDVAGGIAAMRAARGRVVTVAVNSFTFKQPVAIGDLVSFYAKVIRTGTTSSPWMWRWSRNVGRSSGAS